MADVMTPEQRSRCMAAIKGKDTKPEMIVRKYLFSRGCATVSTTVNCQDRLTLC